MLGYITAPGGGGDGTLEGGFVGRRGGGGEAQGIHREPVFGSLHGVSRLLHEIRDVKS